MIKPWDRYYTPHTLPEAIDILEQYGGAARVVAGGTDLLLEIKQGRQPPVAALVDITHIAELARISEQDGEVFIGAAVTHTEVVRNALLAERATCLVESCGVVGGPQVRNVATLGGNVAHALPAADGTTSLVALDADAEVWQGGARRRVNILEMFKGPGKSILDPTHDILLGFHVKLSGPHEASAFKRIMRPQGVALPILGCAVWVRLAEDLHTVEETRICISPTAPVPIRAASVEEVLRGHAYDKGRLTLALEVARRDIHPRASKYRATAEYRAEMIEVLLRRALPLAVERARTGRAIPEGVGL
ncbi:MAG: xanthine dehydrogenase family protein subunit M [Anaerolineae bacterium]